MGSNSSVASFPAYLRMILGPPGCSGSQLGAEQGGYRARYGPGRNSVTSYAFPCTMTQQDSRELCFATSSPVRGPTSGRSPLSRFMVARMEYPRVISVLFLGLDHWYESGEQRE